MHLTLIRPPSVFTVNSYIASITPPIGLAYLAGALLQAGHQVTIVDSIGLDPYRTENLGNGLMLRGLGAQQIIERIPTDTDVIAFSGMFSSEWSSYKKVINVIGEKFKDAFVIAGGEHFTAAPEISMNHCPSIKAIVVGEGEETIVDIANCLSNKANLEFVNGLVLRKGRPGSALEFLRTGPRARIRGLDEIPWPSWDLVPMDNYFSTGSTYGVNLGRSMPMLASRGCPYQCTFCSSPQMWGTRWVARNPKLLVDEIVFYQKKYSITNVDFYDLTAIVKKDWIIEFCNELINRGVKITWQLPSGTRSEAIDSNVCKLLYESGCRNMNYAPETGSENVLKEIKKKVKLDRLLESLRSAVRNKINVKMNIIIGFPFETHLDILKTLFFLVKLSWYGAHDVSIGVFAPYPGSELYDQLVKNGKINHDDDYWQKLAYVDITSTKSYSNFVSEKWLKFYNLTGFIVFYSSNYFFRPARIFITIKNLLSGRHASRGEMALAQIFMRYSDFIKNILNKYKFNF